MSQKATILRMLIEAGEKGVSSRLIYGKFIGRPGARIEDLKKEGYEINGDERDPEDPKYVVYKLVGLGAGAGHVCSESGEKERHAGGRAEPSISGMGAGNATPGVASPELSLFEEAPQKKRPSMFDVDVEAA